jgi:ribosomal protein L21E
VVVIIDFDNLRVVVLYEMVLNAVLFRFTAKKICTTCSRTRNKSAPITYLNKYISSNKSEIEVHKNSSEKMPKRRYE